jgi:hypothetical protein
MEDLFFYKKMEDQNIDENINVQSLESKINIENDNIESLGDILVDLNNKLDHQIGFYWWKKYIAGAFWSNMSTPINLTITLITALTTGQAATKDLIPDNIYINLSIAVLVISTLNTFFRPHLQMMENVNSMQKWTEFGCKYSNIINDIEKNKDGKYIFDLENPKNLEYKIGLLRDLQKTINAHITTITSVNQNFLTDLIHIFARKTCLGNKERWTYLEEANYPEIHQIGESSEEKKKCICC